MPIRPDLRHFYGREWQTVTRPRILERAGHKCEQCKKPNHADVETVTGKIEPAPGSTIRFMFWRLESEKAGVWIDRYGSASLRSQLRRLYDVRIIHVVLTVAHLNHVAGDDRDENLRALCQWCHLVYDYDHHRESRGARKDESRPLLQQIERIPC